jgi:hypothetical protein
MLWVDETTTGMMFDRKELKRARVEGCIAGRLIGDVRDLVDWGVESGQIDEQQLRLTIEARREKAKELVDAGLSQSGGEGAGSC